MRWGLFIILFCIVNPLAARMYQWTNPDTGTAYLSGTPPVWYRATADGPRIQVFEQGRLIDDTEWRASREREKALREKALKEIEARKEEQARRKAEKERAAREQAEKAAAKDEQTVTREEDAVAIFRALITEWDKRQNPPGGTPGKASGDKAGTGQPE